MRRYSPRKIATVLPWVRMALALTVITLPTLSLLSLTAPLQTRAGRLPVLGDCDRLAVSGGKVAFHVYATGVQIYRWDGVSWIFVAPDALLFADDGNHGLVGTHYAGPTWQTVSGSKVIGAVIDRCTPDPNAIPWLLLGAASNEGPGVFDHVALIQRVNTTGGIAPADSGHFVGELARVHYTAEYFFYR